MIIRRNLYNMLFGYYVFLRRCESDYLHPLKIKNPI